MKRSAIQATRPITHSVPGFRCASKRRFAPTEAPLHPGSSLHSLVHHDVTDSVVKQREGHTSTFSLRHAPELCVDCPPSKQQEGAGKAGCALHPRSRVPIAQDMRTRAYRAAEAIRLSLRGALRIIRGHPGDRAFLPPSPARLNANLTPASGCQAHTASPSATAALVIRRHRVHRIPPRVRDDRDPPLSSGETGSAIEMICPTG